MKLNKFIKIVSESNPELTDEVKLYMDMLERAAKVTEEAEFEIIEPKQIDNNKTEQK